MSASTIARPTENAAIGAAMRHRPNWNLALLYIEQDNARRGLDRHAEHLLGYRIDRQLAAGKVGE
jgi:hypothetical protein